MRISLLADATLYPLAGQSGVSERVHSSAGDFQMTPASAQQIAEYVRGDNAMPIDRGNLLHTISFTTSRLFATVEEAWLFCLDYDRLTPRSGTLLLDAVGPAGDVDRRHLTNAVVKPPQRRNVGCSVLLSYSVDGSEIVDSVSVHASGTVTFSGLPTAAQTVTVGSRVYTWASALTASNQVKIGATAAACAFNLAHAILAVPASAGTLFGTGTVAHETVTAAEPGAAIVTVTAKIPGVGGNAIALSETSSNVAVSGATLTGGVE